MDQFLLNSLIEIPVILSFLPPKSRKSPLIQNIITIKVSRQKTDAEKPFIEVKNCQIVRKNSFFFVATIFLAYIITKKIFGKLVAQ